MRRNKDSGLRFQKLSPLAPNILSFLVVCSSQLRSATLSFMYLLPYCPSTVFKHILNRRGESEHPCLTDFRGNAFSFSSFTTILEISFLTYPLLCQRKFLFFLFFKDFCCERSWFFSKIFILIEMIMRIWFLILFLCHIMLTDLCMLSHPCIHEMKQIWSSYMIF
jgi:hypothetical protein